MATIGIRDAPFAVVFMAVENGRERGGLGESRIRSSRLSGDPPSYQELIEPRIADRNSSGRA